jgi:hypothetical protein
LRLVAVNIFLYLGRGFWWSNLLPECLCLLILDRQSDHHYICHRENSIAGEAISWTHFWRGWHVCYYLE